MTEENLRLLENLYQQYNIPIKPLLAEIEAVYEKFPLALYNEIRAMNDHVARAFTTTDDDKAKKQIEKAYNHINRITRDCYKFLNLFYKQEAEKFDRSICSIEPRTTEDFKRMADYGSLSDKATRLVEIAKQNEHLVSDEETYQNYQNSYNAYRELHQFIVDNRRDVLSMNRKRRFKAVGSVIFSIITFILGCIVTNNNQEIVEVFKSFVAK
ncbi:MAG: hypothetical protein LUG83_00785 [Lachnospiraceae bacterium]|nr:hypothetical protein [Lachnospiraceae bacterium]